MFTIFRMTGRAGCPSISARSRFLWCLLFSADRIKNSPSLHVKLNELISATKHADNHLINVEELTEKEISVIQEIHREIGTTT